MINHNFTVDVEEYFQVSAFEDIVPRSAWESLEYRVSHGITALLELLAAHNGTATFFVLGWIAERHGQLIREIARAGHEVASHGWDHRRVTCQTPDDFRTSVRQSKDILEQLTGTPVLGFRAPSFSIVQGREWALDVLIEEGYAYDSSLFPVRRRGYGYAGGRRDPHCIERPSGWIRQVPPTTLRRWGVNIPAAGGAYFRLLPYGLIRSAFESCEGRGAPATFYIHPWELDADQPRIPAPWPTRIRHYGGLARTPARLKRLLGDFQFSAIADSIAVPT